MVAPLREERGPLLRDEVLKGQKFPVVIRTGGGRVCLVPIRERYFILGVFLFLSLPSVFDLITASNNGRPPRGIQTGGSRRIYHSVYS